MGAMICDFLSKEGLMPTNAFLPEHVDIYFEMDMGWVLQVKRIDGKPRNDDLGYLTHILSPGAQENWTRIISPPGSDFDSLTIVSDGDGMIMKIVANSNHSHDSGAGAAGAVGA